MFPYQVLMFSHLHISTGAGGARAAEVSAFALDSAAGLKWNTVSWKEKGVGVTLRGGILGCWQDLLLGEIHN